MRASLRRTVAPISERWLGNTEDSKIVGTPLQTPNFDSATTMHGDLSKEPSSSANARWVSSLLLPDNERWNAELIRDLFDPMVVNRIMKTPVNREMEDGWYWRHELRGGYPVRSGYKLLSNPPQENNNFNSWGKLWKLDVAPNPEPFMEMCQGNFAGVWAATGFPINLTAPNFSRWLESVLAKANGETQKKIAVIIWFIWCERNALVWNNKSFNANNVLRQALNWLTDWFDLIKRKVMTKVRTESPQPTATLRCFVDVALFENADLAGFGVIAVNNEDLLSWPVLPSGPSLTVTGLRQGAPYYSVLTVDNTAQPHNTVDNTALRPLPPTAVSLPAAGHRSPDSPPSRCLLRVSSSRWSQVTGLTAQPLPAACLFPYCSPSAPR
nr:uncharacterized protein LOC109159815 [Ipomoea batatas]